MRFEINIHQPIPTRLLFAIARLSCTAEQLASVIESNSAAPLGKANQSGSFSECQMAADLSDEIAAVEAANTVMASAITLISGIQAKIEAAVAAALENGATAEQLAPLSDLTATMAAKTQELADAVAANTPAA